MSKIFIAIFFFLFSVKVIFNILNEKAKTEDCSTYHGFLYFQRWFAKYVVRSHFLLFAFVVARANEKGKRASLFQDL